MKPTIKFHTFTFDPDADPSYPVPTITTSINSDRTPAYQYLGSTQNINLQGYIVDSKKDGDSSSVACCQNLLHKAMALKSGIISPVPRPFVFLVGSRPVISGSGYVRELIFDTSEKNGVNILPYSIDIEFSSFVTGRTPINDKNIIYNVTNAEDSLSINVSDKYYVVKTGELDEFFPLFDITRTLSAQGNYTTSSGALTEAICWINDRKRLFPASSVLNTTQFPLFNHKRNIETNELDGSITITDQFVSKPIEPQKPWAESYTLDNSVNSDAEQGIKAEISFKGTILGLLPAPELQGLDAPFNLEVVKSGQKLLQPFNNISSGSKYDGAVSGYNSLVLAQAWNIRAQKFYNNLVGPIINNIGYTGIILPLNTGSPVRYSETFDPFNGQITYDITYANGRKPCISGAIFNSESVTVTNSNPMQRTTNIPVLGRRLGPVVYYFTDSSGLGNRSVNYEATFPTGDCKNPNFTNTILTDIDRLIENYKPKPPYIGYVVGNDHTININTGRITKSKTWSYTTIN